MKNEPFKRHAFGYLVAAQRKNLNISQSQAAVAIGISRSSVFRIEDVDGTRSTHPPSIDMETIRRTCNWLDIKIQKLF